MDDAEEMVVLRRRADDEQREWNRAHQAALNHLTMDARQLSGRQTRLETVMADWAQHQIRTDTAQATMQQQIITLIGAQSRTDERLVSHMEAEERVWAMIQNNSLKLSNIEAAVSTITGVATSQIANIKIALGAAIMAALSFASYVMTRLHGP